MQPTRVYEEKSERLKRVHDHLRERLSGTEVEEAAEFFDAFFERVAPDDILHQSVENLYGGALSAWRFGKQRKSGEAKVRVYNPRMEEHGWKSAHTIVEIVNDDMPFLVDSVSSELGRRKTTLHMIIHPVVDVMRDADGQRTGIGDADGKGMRESYMHLQIDEQSNTEELAELKETLENILDDCRSAVEDWRQMLQKLDESVEQTKNAAGQIDAEEVDEATEFLLWMRDNHFTFLGCRDYAYNTEDGEPSLDPVADSGLGIMRDAERRVLYDIRDSESAAPIVIEFFDRPELVLITKTSMRGVVHRAVHMDYVGVKLFDAEGRAVGERRFVGLFTSAAYNRTPRDIPLLRRKVWQVVSRSGLSPSSHDGKALIHILETYPRDELFQIDIESLHEISVGILALHERPQIRLFARQDKFKRYYSCIIFIPRERLSTELRRKFEAILVQFFNGRISNYYTQVGDSPLARLHYIVGINVLKSADAIDYEMIEARLVEAARSWHDDLHDALTDSWGEEGGNRLFARYGQAFTAAYTESFHADLARGDIVHIETLKKSDDLALNFYRAIEDPGHRVRFKIYHPEAAVPLSDCLPMLENMGLRVIGESPFMVRRVGAIPVSIQDFILDDPYRESLELAALKQKFESAFEKVWRGDVEDDAFNRLVLRSGLDWREVSMLRAYCKYLRQTGIPFSQAYMQDTLADNPDVTRKFVDYFNCRFDPVFDGDRRVIQAEIEGDIEALLEQVISLDEDRILRRYLNALQSTLRTNYFQRDKEGAVKPYIAFKLDSQALAELPLPRPFREIFVYSPRVEAIHLRGGRVARGGLRWSDRREDFRTEVLGLMKAQMVKNAVIVPVGSKGGFVAKRLPLVADRDAIQQEVIACYKTFIQGMLDITDNFSGAEVIPPQQVVRYDDDDPYLVVAADKGTATFSDIANGLAVDNGFWLGDAFASGGATGYDHKKMGITARGAWESVKRHFRELGRDTQSEPFTVVGVGDMSGDVFGNGMLLSRFIKLVAAFDHRHIFIDPDPDPEASYVERERMFALPRSNWQDYNAKLISKGGGVFPRDAKSIELTPQIKKLTGLSVKSCTPAALMHALLTAEVDLFWNGGIGTYVKASDESNEQVGDRANDALRVDGKELRCRVVGEGGNLGLTQLGRIEAAQHGVRLNTDAVDNSAGVDSSDHEVNIKILLNAVVDDGEMTEKQRNRQLEEMTEEVGLFVLQNNYLQTQSLSIIENESADLLGQHRAFMNLMERQGALDRAVEFLPDEEELLERAQNKRGLTRPELSVLFAYAKMDLYDKLLASDLVESNHLRNDLVKYFPRPLRRKFREQIMEHRLRSEIVATVTANSIINRVGIQFVHDILAQLGCSAGEVARSYVVVREAFAMRPIWNAIEALDNKVATDVQIAMHQVAADLLRRATEWVLRFNTGDLRISRLLALYGQGIHDLSGVIEEILGSLERKAMQSRMRQFVKAGVPEDLAYRVAALEPMSSALDIVDVAREHERPVKDVGKVYFALGGSLSLDWMRAEAEALPVNDHWERMSVQALIDDLFSQQRALTGLVIRQGQDKAPDAAIAQWLKDHKRAVSRGEQMIEDFKASGGLDIPKLAVANRDIRRMIIE